MGNFKFRLSDMIPSAWLRKLKHANSMSSSRKALLPSADNQNYFSHNARPPPMVPCSTSPLDYARRRKSYYFSRQSHVVQPLRPLTPPRRSTSKPRRSAHLRRPTRRSSPRLVNTSVLACCSCRSLAGFNLTRLKPGCPVLTLPPNSPSTDAIFPQSPRSFRHGSGSAPSSESFDKVVSWNNIRSSCRCRANFNGPVTLARGFDRDPLSELELPPVITKSQKFNGMFTSSRKGGENKNPVTTNNSRSSSSSSSFSAKFVNEETYNRTVRVNHEQKKPGPIINLTSSPAGGVRLRVNSPKVGSRKQSQAHHPRKKSMNNSASSHTVMNNDPRTRKSRGGSDGFAVVKSSADPWKDFRESMVEMIVENDIRALKDLEDLLACYLTLNSDEYHDVIIGVFKQIWFDFDRACEIE